MEKEYKVNGLNELSNQLHEFQISAGFTDSNIIQRLMLVHSEISEAFEAHRKDKRYYYKSVRGLFLPDEKFKRIFERDVKDTMEDEIADAIIRLLAFCGENEINIESHIKGKMRYNNLRGFKYGGKKF